MHVFEKWAMRLYLARALGKARFARPPLADADIVFWVECHGRELGLPALPSSEAGRNRREAGRYALPHRSWAEWRKSVIRLGDAPPPRPSPQEKRIRWLCERFGLEPAQNEVFGLLARLSASKPLLSLAEAINGGSHGFTSSLEPAELTSLLPADSVREASSAFGKLTELGLADTNDGVKPTEIIRSLLALPRLSSRSVLNLMLGPAVAANLEWDFFAHLGETRDLAARIVQAAASAPRGEPGINLLLYGPPGSGKTEFAKTLGARLGLSVHFLGERGQRGAEPERRERIAALVPANAIGGFRRKALLVLDEADDVFVGVDEEDGSARRGSKVFMNRLIESAVAPTIWIANDPDRLGPAVIRRMTLCLRFPRPSLAARKKIVARIAGAIGYPLPAQAVETLAARSTSPALVATALRTAKLIRGSPRDAGHVLDAGMRAMGASPDRCAFPALPFDPSLSAANLDLIQLADQVARSHTPALSFCLSGPPGTGKSAYARHLAQRLSLEVVEKRYSDLVSKYVGDSEKAIAIAFEEAADQQAFLILDEADSLLADRRDARHSWEVTQVNEMLTQIERHPYPLACTTNAFEALDQASLRRFLFKVEFLPMSRAQIRLAFRRFFRADAPPQVCELELLAPADFANVARRLTITGPASIAQIALLLEEEVSVKRGAPRRIGF